MWDHSKYTILMHAASCIQKRRQCYNICKLLLDNGADINFVNCEGDSAFNCASAMGNLAVVQLFLQYGNYDNNSDKNNTNNNNNSNANNNNNNFIQNINNTRIINLAYKNQGLNALHAADNAVEEVGWALQTIEHKMIVEILIDLLQLRSTYHASKLFHFLRKIYRENGQKNFLQ